MPIFEIEQNGRRFQVDAPDIDAADKAASEFLNSTATPSDKAKDAGKSLASGAAEGTAEVIGAPRSFMSGLMNLGMNTIPAAGNWVRGKVGLEPLPGPDAQTRKDVARAVTAMTPWSDQTKPGQQTAVSFGDTNVASVPNHIPESTAGKYAGTVGKFLPGAIMGGAESAAPRALLGAGIRYGVIPGVASEAAGQATEGSKYEPYARTAAALAAGGAAAWQQLPSYGERLIGRAAQGATPQQYNVAEALMREAQARGVQLTPAEAIQATSNGATRLSDVQRLVESTVEGSQRLSPMFAARPGQMSAATGRSLDNVGAVTATPSYQGSQLQEAAQGALDRIRQRINNMAQPYYNNLPHQRIQPQEMAALAQDPSYAAALHELRANPELNARIAGLPDDSVAVVNAVVQRLDRNVEAARQTAMNPGGDNALAATRQGARGQADTAAASASSDYRDARNIVRTGREQVLEPLNASPMGAVARTADPAAQGEALMPRNPLPGSDAETRRTVRLLAAENPGATQGVVRGDIERTANRTVNALDAGGQPDQFGGARFAREMRGDPQRAANINAAIEEASGPAAAADVNRLLDVLQATGTRQRKGSLTAFNAEALEDMKSGGAASVVQALLKPLQQGKDAVARARLGRQSSQLAELLMSGPEGVRRIQEMAANGNAGARAVARALLSGPPAAEDARQRAQ